MNTKPILLRGAGRLKVAQYDSNGVLGGYRPVGAVPMLKLEPKVTMGEHREDESGYRFKDARWADTSDLTVSFTLENASIENFALGFFGDISTETGTGTFTATLEAGLLAGLDYKFGKPGYKVTSVTAADDSVVDPATYRVNKDGTITFMNAQISAVTITGNKAASSSTSILTRQTPTIALLFEGLNTTNSRSPVIVDLPRVGLNPAKSYDLIGSQISKMDIDGEALSDPNSISDGVISGYGTITLA